MKVAIVLEHIETWRGGAETSTLEYAHLLARRGIQVELLTASRCPSPPDLAVQMLPLGGVPRPFRALAFARRAAAFLDRADFDVVHAISPLPCADVYEPRGGTVRETLRRNFSTRPPGLARTLKRFTTALDLKQHTLLHLERRICRPGGPAIAAVSGYVARQLAEHYGLAEPRVRVVFNGVQVEASTPERRAANRLAIRAQHGVEPSTLLLLFVAHNYRLKGLEPLIGAVARAAAANPDLRLLVIGRDNPVRYAALAQRLGVADRVTFIGSTQRVGAFFHAADACVHPTYYDPCSRVVLEAIAWGVPCITTRYNGAAEIMTDGVHGYVMNDPADVAALADCIGRLHDPVRRAAMGARTAELREAVSMNRHVDGMLKLYEEVLAARRSRDAVGVGPGAPLAMRGAGVSR